MRVSIRGLFPDCWIKFLLFVTVTAFFTYYMPRELSIFWAAIVITLYYRSKDEAFWLAFFLVTTDGFIGIFGLYEVSIPIIPGLPSIEIVQLYILLSFVKALRIRGRPFIFYKKYLWILMIYLLFIIVWGQFLGFNGELNVYFRVIKLVMPMIMFFTIPRLFHSMESYNRLFSFIFIIVVLAFAAQIFTLISGFSPTLSIHKISAEELAEAGHYRGFYNVAANLIGLFGALFFLATNKVKAFSYVYLFIVIISAFGMAYLSASRGWILFYSSVILLTLIMAFRKNAKPIIGFSAVFILAAYTGMNNPILKRQSEYSIERLDTLKLLASGDITAGHTLQRLDYRSPRVMKKWVEKPVFGWGFSDTFFKYQDGHVGNQNILLFSGVIGYVLLICFLIYFSLKMIHRSITHSFQPQGRSGYIVFIIFLLGWFFLHSSGAQCFGFYGLPIQIIPQAVFFSLGALVYGKPREIFE